MHHFVIRELILSLNFFLFLIHVIHTLSPLFISLSSLLIFLSILLFILYLAHKLCVFASFLIIITKVIHSSNKLFGNKRIILIVQWSH